MTCNDTLTIIKVVKWESSSARLCTPTAPTGECSSAENLTAFFGRHTFPAGFTSLFAAFFPAFSAQRYCVRILLLLFHSGPIVACKPWHSQYH